MTKYAENTSVSVERSKAEIERTLGRYGASGFMYGTSETHAMIGFEMLERRVKCVLSLPDKAAPEFAAANEVCSELLGGATGKWQDGRKEAKHALHHAYAAG